MKEVWKDIPGYKKYYQVSNLGRVKSLRRSMLLSNGRLHTVRGRVLKGRKNSDGYLTVAISNRKKIIKGTSIHRLVMWAFKGKSKLQVNHKNFIKTDNRLENLEYVTNYENSLHLRSSYGRELPVGVSYGKTKGTYKAQSYSKDGKYHLGTFPTLKLAHEAYLKKVKPKLKKI